MKGSLLAAHMLYSTVLLTPVLCLVTAPGEGGATMAGPYGTAPTPPTAPIGIAPDATVVLAKEAAPAADDTGRNVQDRDGMTMTPLDQSNDPDDIKITRKIRKALVADDALSTTAKNIKIITVHGKVILRGPVANVQEKKKIGKTAQKFSKQRVLNELEVATQ